MEERMELEGIKREMAKLAEHLDTIDVDLDSEVVADVLTELSEGHTADAIIDRYGLVDEEGV